MAEGLLPDVQAQLLLPGVKARTIQEGAFEHITEPTVAAREDALEIGRRAVMTAQAEAPIAAHCLPQQRLLAAYLRKRIERAPLKRCVRLRHMRRDADRDLGALAPQPVGDGQRVAPDLQDAEHVLVFLR